MTNESVAGTTVSAGGDVGRRGVNFAIFSEHATKVDLCLI